MPAVDKDTGHTITAVRIIVAVFTFGAFHGCCNPRALGAPVSARGCFFARIRGDDVDAAEVADPATASGNLRRRELLRHVFFRQFSVEKARCLTTLCFFRKV